MQSFAQHRSNIHRVGLIVDPESVSTLTPRMKDVLQLTCQCHTKDDLVVDVSQSIAPFLACDGCCPCITPGSVLYSVRSQRIITPMEKMTLHGFPANQLDSDIVDTGGTS